MDWTSSLPEPKRQAFKRYVRELDSSYLMLSITLDEAIGSRKEGLQRESLEHLLILPELAAYFANHLDGILRAMQQHVRIHGAEPNVAPLDPANFLSPDGIQSARRSQLASLVLLTKRRQAIEKIRALRLLMRQIETGLRGAARELISAGAAPLPTPNWEALDALHYDLNTCLRETIVLLKCFLRAIPDAGLAEFQNIAATMHSQPRIRTHRHDILFCSDETTLLNGLTSFIADALTKRNPAVVWATEPHKEKLRRELRRMGINVDAAIRAGLYLASDVSEPPDAERLVVRFTSLREAAIRAGNEHPRIAVCGERAGRMCGEGQTDVALQLEQNLNQLANAHGLDILCIYPFPTSLQEEIAVKTICGEHSAVSSE
jgi:hypothetical protein